MVSARVTTIRAKEQKWPPTSYSFTSQLAGALERIADYQQQVGRQQFNLRKESDQDSYFHDMIQIKLANKYYNVSVTFMLGVM